MDSRTGLLQPDLVKQNLRLSQSIFSLVIRDTIYIV